MITYKEQVLKKAKPKKKNFQRKWKQKKNISNQLGLTQKTYDLNHETKII